MPQRVTITVGAVRAEAVLNDSATARALAEALPLEGRASTWGDEIYFQTPVEAEIEHDARATLDVGELAYWPPGNALCIFFGPTPASGDDGVPAAASAVNPVGRIEGDPTLFRQAPHGAPIRVDAAD